MKIEIYQKKNVPFWLYKTVHLGLITLIGWSTMVLFNFIKTLTEIAKSNEYVDVYFVFAILTCLIVVLIVLINQIIDFFKWEKPKKELEKVVMKCEKYRVVRE